MPISPTQVRELVEKLVAERGFDLEDITVRSRDGQEELSIVVDRDGGSDLDVLAGLSTEISDLLDATPDFADLAYVLEVTSRGVDRPLVAPRHWRRNADRLVKVTLEPPLTGEVVGRVLDCDEDADGGGVRLDVKGEVRRLAYADIKKALVQVEFNRRSTGADDAADEGGDA